MADGISRNGGDEGRGGKHGERRGRGRSGGPGGARKFIRKPKVCAFCVEKNARIDYKQIDVVRRYVTERGKIRPRRQTGMCARHQRAHVHGDQARATPGVAAVHGSGHTLDIVSFPAQWRAGVCTFVRHRKLRTGQLDRGRASPSPAGQPLAFLCLLHVNRGIGMSKASKVKLPKEMTRKHLARAEREARQQRLLLISIAAVVVVAIGLVGYGFLDERVLKQQQPVAQVNGKTYHDRRFSKAREVYARADHLSGQPTPGSARTVCVRPELVLFHAAN